MSETSNIQVGQVKNTPIRGNLFIFIATTVSLLILAFDLALPLGVAAGVPYIALVLIGLWHPEKQAVFFLAIIGTFLTIVGYFLSAPMGIHWMVLINRGLALFAIWVTAVLCYQRKQYEKALDDALHLQEKKVRERTHDLTEEIEDRYRAEAALQSSEQNFRILMEQASDAIFVFDGTGRILETNSAALDMAGLSEQSLLHTMSFGDIFTSQKIEDVRKPLLTLKTGVAKSFALFICRPDGSTLPVEVNAKGLSDGRIHASVRDISQRLAYEEKERLHQAEIARAWRIAAIGEMSTVLAHELNQPLAVISGCTQALRGELSDREGSHEEISQGLKQIFDQSERANAIIRRVRAFVRKEPPQRRILNVCEVIEGLADMLVSLGRPYEVEVNFDLDEGTPSISGDKIQIEQVILNLARNAIEATHENSGHAMTLRVQKAGNGGAEILISDEGAGISETDIDHVLDPFFTTKDDGLGMGLAISNTIVEGHGGSLRLYNSNGQGCVAHVIFPILEEEGAIAI